MAGFKIFNNPILREKKLLKKAKVGNKDFEKKALLYILAMNKELYENVDFLYDFEMNLIKPETLEEGKIKLSSDARKLAILGFNLFNGYTTEKDNALNIFNMSERKNFIFATYALGKRFDRDMR